MKKKIKSALKLFSISTIDRNEDLTKVNSLIKVDEQKADELVEKINSELSKEQGAEKIILKLC